MPPATAQKIDCCQRNGTRNREAIEASLKEKTDFEHPSQKKKKKKLNPEPSRREKTPLY